MIVNNKARREVKGLFILFVIFVGVIGAIVIGSLINPPSEYEAISFVEKGIKNSIKDPDSATFTNVKFYPDSSQQGDTISGYVCGYVNAKNSFGGYVGNKRFWSKISVSNNGGTANLIPPFIEDTNNAVSVGAMDKLWEENCPYHQ